MALENLFSLTGQTALVTGGARGIGEHIATGLADAGADLILVSRNLENLERAAANFSEKFGVKVDVATCDLGDPASVKDMFQEVTSRHPKIDILVNNAGVAEFGATLEYTQAQWDRTFDVNVRGVWLLTQDWANYMKEQGGCVINVSSIMGYRGSHEGHNVVAYNPSKAAVINLTENLAVKLADYGIRVNGIAPGYFLTDMMDYIEGERMAGVKQAVLDSIPLKRGGELDDMRGVIVFLASRASQFMTGHTLVVDGGRLAY